jgi:ADP-ribosylglycohydrolase
MGVVINAEEYYRKAYGAWLGKNVGGTLGEPVEGRKERLDLSFYPELPSEVDTSATERYPDATDDGAPTPLANDDLDLQLIWLHALEQYGPRVTAADLGEEWLDHVFFPYNEYRYALANLRRGVRPPLSGWFNNEFYNDCMGAPIRSEIWALVAPGAPDLAVRYAYEDAIVDHAGGEGVYGELFNAALESAAFVESDPRTLLDLALSYVPEDCEVASAVRDTVSWIDEDREWAAVREHILDSYGSEDMTYAPMNVAFVVLGWLTGEDFGDALLKCVNCGYDTDSSGATIGSLLGILAGKDGIPDRWVEPVGHRVVTRPQVKGFPAPDDLDELTRRTREAARRVLDAGDAPVEIAPGEPTSADSLPVGSERDLRGLWEADPRIVEQRLPAGSRGDESLRVEVEHDEDGPAIERGGTKTLGVTVENPTDERWRGEAGLAVPDGWSAGLAGEIDLAGGESTRLEATVSAGERVRPSYPLALELTRLHDGSPWTTRAVEFALVPARHWRVSGPDADERAVAVPGDRLDFGDAVGGDAVGVHRARTTLSNPRDREMRLEVHTASAATVTLDGEVVIDASPQALPDMLVTRTARVDLAAGEHELLLELDRKAGDEPPAAYVVPAGTEDTETPGEYYYLTDVTLR